MTEKQDVKKSVIKEYWDIRPPQMWYSNKKERSLEWFNEIEYKRYNVYNSFFKDFMEFENHTGEKVLEVGVGIGTDLVQYAKNGAKVYGIDLTENAIKLTKINLKLKGLKGCLQVADAENLPFKDNSFDLVVSIGTIHHTPNTEKCVEEIHRVLKPEGKAIVLVYARGWKHYFKRVFLHGILLGKLFKYGYNQTVNMQTEPQGNSPLTYIYKRREVREMFNMFGEVEVKRYRLGEYFDYAPYKTRKLPNFIQNIFYLFTLERLLGESHVVKAVKTDKKRRVSFWRTLLKP